MYFWRTSASSVLLSGSKPGNRFSLWGIKIPPSEAPFMAPNTRLPVEVRRRPTSRYALNGRGSSSPTVISSDSSHAFCPTKRRLTSLGELHLASGLNNTLVLVGKAELGQSPTSDQQTSSVRGGPVGQTVLDTVSGELFGRSVGEDEITLELGVDDLADDLLVGDSDDLIR